MKKSCFVVTFVASLLFSLQIVFAHEFIVKPERISQAEAGKVGVSVISAHVFMQSEEVEPIEQVEVYLLSSKRQDIPLTINEQKKVLEGEFNINGGSSYFICGHRKPMIWTKTTEGWKQESKKDLTGVISSGVYEKFSKALISGKEGGEQYKDPVGHRLEIIPTQNPAKLSEGDEFQVKVLYDGKPIATDLYATFDGFSASPGTYAYFSTTDEHGVGTIKITQTGTWMVRVEHEVDDSNENYDKQVLRAVFLFGVGHPSAG